MWRRQGEEIMSKYLHGILRFQQRLKKKKKETFSLLFPAMLSACHFLPASLAVCTRQAAAVLKERRTVRVKKSYHYIIKNNRKVTSSSRRKPEQQFRFQSSLHSVNFKLQGREIGREMGMYTVVTC